MDVKEAARALKEISRLLEVKGESVHRVRAFGNAARVVEKIDGDLEEMVTSGEILQLRGIGKGTAAVLEDMASGDRPSVLSGLENEIPAGVRDLLAISGLGPKKVGSLWRDLGVSSVGELEYACRENRLLELSGFGAATQERILEGIRFNRRVADRRLINEAHTAAAAMIEEFESSEAVDHVMVTGEIRRWCETVGVLDLVVVAADEAAAGEAAEAQLTDCRRVESGVWHGLSGDGLDVRLTIANPDQAAYALFSTTGSDDHLAAIEHRARQGGIELRSDGLWRDNQRVEAADEHQIYEALGCAWMPPELREVGSDVERAAAGTLPEVVSSGDLRGALHNHTTDSDGLASAEEMAAAAADLGWSFVGIADHSPVAVYANGVDAPRLRSQWQRIDDFNRGKPGIRIVKGLEADILGDGGLDIPDGCEEGLEYVVASVHSAFRLSEERQTERVVAAVSHPACRVLGHPTGRLLLARPGFALNLEEVLQACARNGVALEINASPYRLDLDWRWARRALELGLKLIVNPDAHAPRGLADVKWGLAVARKAGATAADLVNCGDIEEFIGER